MWILPLLLACKPDAPTPVGDDDDDDDDSSIVSPTADTGHGTPTVAPTLSDVTVVPHPTFASVATVRWTQDVAGDARLSFGLAGEPELSAPLRALGPGTHEELILGVPHGASVAWRLEVTNAAGTDEATGRHDTGPLPAGVPAADLLVLGAHDPAVDYVLVSFTAAGGSFGDPWWTLVLDRQGRAVWARRSQPERVSMHPRLAWHEDAILIDQNAFWGAFSFTGGVVEKLTLDGEVLRTWDAPGIHHPIQELEGEVLAYGAFTSPYSEVLALVQPDGTWSALWSCDDEVARFGTSFCASNTLNYDAATDTFLFSFWTLETVFQIDAATGATLRSFGHLPDSFAFDPPDSTFWYQHGAHLLPDGHLLVSTHAAEENKELVAREYVIDVGASTLREVWNVGLGDLVPGNQMGDAYRLPGGHTLQTFGTNARMREYAPDGTVVWDVTFDTSHIGRATGLVDLYALAGARP